MNRPRRTPVPKEALLLSLLSLLVPVLASAAFPGWTTEQVGVLLWLLALVPGFLLSFYRGWTGASVALAAGMAAFALAQVYIVATGSSEPGPELLLGVVVVLTSVSLGSGWLSSVFHRSLDEVEAMALTDPGTGIPNRRRAALHLERVFAAARRGVPLSVVLFDLDHFKRVNDAFGHAVGDDVLSAFADMVVDQTRTMNVTARYGGEEFISILAETDAEGARHFAGRVLKATRELELPSGPITVSAGIAQYEDGMAAPEVLVAAADQALYRAKNAGRDRVVILEPQGRRHGGAPAPVSAASVDAGEAPRGEGEVVLIVDQDADALRWLGRALKRFGYRVIEAPSPERAVALAREGDGDVDLLVTDLIMPEMSGFRLVEILSGFHDGLRVLYVSGHHADAVDWGGVPGTAWDYLSRPVSLPTLARKVRAVLEAPAAGQAPKVPATEV